MMRRFILFFAFSLISFVCLGVDMPEPLGPVTIEQAKQSILNWAGRQNLEISFEGRSSHPGCLYWEFQCYKFFVWDPNPDHKYSGYVMVDSFSGLVTEIERPARLIEAEPHPPNMISPSQAINIAKEVALSYFPNVPIDSLTLDTEPKIINNGASWDEYSDTITLWFAQTSYTPSGERVWMRVRKVGVGLISDTGEWWGIDCVYEPLEINPLPTISTDDAINSAISFIYALGAEYVELEEVEDDWWLLREEGGGPQRVVKEVHLECFPSPYEAGEGGGVLLWVDGHTGEIWRYEFSWGGGFSPEKKKSLALVYRGKELKWKEKPIIRNGGIFISLKDLEAMGMKVRKEGKGYTLSYKDDKAKMGREDIINVKGKAYIKSDALKKLKGIEVKLLKEFNILNIWVRNEKGYSQGKEELKKKK